MPFIPEAGKGRLFDNTVDKTKDSQPDYNGSASCPCCQEHIRISAWRYPPSERQRVATLSLQLKSWADWEREKAERAERTVKKAENNQGSYPDEPPPDYDDDIPF